MVPDQFRILSVDYFELTTHLPSRADVPVSEPTEDEKFVAPVTPPPAFKCRPKASQLKVGDVDKAAPKNPSVEDQAGNLDVRPIPIPSFLWKELCLFPPFRRPDPCRPSATWAS